MMVSQPSAKHELSAPSAGAQGLDRAEQLDLFGLSLLNAPQDHAIALMLTKGRRRVAFVNAHCVNVAAKDPAYRQALETADVLLPDGAGIELAARLHGQRMVANLNGTDLCPALLAEAAARGKSVFLLGAKPGVAAAAAARLTDLIPSLRIAGTRDGFAGAKPEGAIAAVSASRADILLVAMGVPKQDIWLHRAHDSLHPDLVLGVGALFDFLAGTVPRAPVWMRRARLEWLWRLAIEPRRMFGRYVIGNVVFVMRALCARAFRKGQA
ncbi:MAG: WecB/TagA/CpsF family glycosyltransferase [Roseinatronobacter sp.]